MVELCVAVMIYELSRVRFFSINGYSVRVNLEVQEINTVRDNTKIIGRSDNWRILAFKESLKIKDKKPSLNNGVKATKDLCLF